MISEFIFDREEERQRIDQFLVKRRPVSPLQTIRGWQDASFPQSVIRVSIGEWTIGGNEEDREKSCKPAGILGLSDLRIATATLSESWLKQRANHGAGDAIVRDALTRTVQEQTESLRRRLDSMAHKLLETLRAAATALEVEDSPIKGEFSGVLREMPAFDAAHGGLPFKHPFYLGLIGENLSTSLIARRLIGMMGEQLAISLSAYHALLYDWSERTLAQIQCKFDDYANSHRAQLERLVGDHSSPQSVKA